MSAKCNQCGTGLSGNWSMTKCGNSYDQTGRYLGVNGYFLYGESGTNWVYCYCHNCWKQQILNFSFVKSGIIVNNQGSKCAQCSKALNGSWNMTKCGNSYDQTGRYLGVTANFLNETDGGCNFVYCYCRPCYIKKVSNLSFIRQEMSKVTNLENEIKRLKPFQQSNAQLDQKNKNLSNEVERLKNEINKLKNLNDNLNKNNTSTNNQVASLTNQLNESKNELNSVKNDKSSLIRKQSELNNEIERLRNENDLMNKEMLKLKEKENEITNEMYQVRSYFVNNDRF